MCHIRLCQRLGRTCSCSPCRHAHLTEGWYEQIFQVYYQQVMLRHISPSDMYTPFLSSSQCIFTSFPPCSAWIGSLQVCTPSLSSHRCLLARPTPPPVRSSLHARSRVREALRHGPPPAPRLRGIRTSHRMHLPHGGVHGVLALHPLSRLRHRGK